MENSSLTNMLAAAQENKGEAQYDLGLAYLNGEGVPQNFEEAYFWLTICAQTKRAFWSPSPDELAADAVLHLTEASVMDDVLNRVTLWFAVHDDPVAGDY